MIELLKTQPDGSRTWLVRHLKTVTEQDGYETDADGEHIPVFVDVERDAHKPQRYTTAPKAGDAEGATDSEQAEAEAQARADAEEFAALVLANHEAGRPLAWREETEADRQRREEAREQERQRREERQALKDWQPTRGQLQERVAEMEDKLQRLAQVLL